MVLLSFLGLAVLLLVVMRALFAGMDLRADLSATAELTAGVEGGGGHPQLAATGPAHVGRLPGPRHG
jgi:hypothetical protein